MPRSIVLNRAPPAEKYSFLENSNKGFCANALFIHRDHKEDIFLKSSGTNSYSYKTFGDQPRLNQFKDRRLPQRADNLSLDDGNIHVQLLGVN